MKKIFLKFSAIFLLSLVILFKMSSNTFADTLDTAATLQDMQAFLDTAMHNRINDYSIIYTGDASNLSADIRNIRDNILKADDYLNFSTKSYGGYSCSGTTGNLTITIHNTYWNTAEMDAYVDTQTDNILSQIITPDMNDMQKEKAIHDWIIKNVSYDSTLAKHSDYDALVYPYKTVCQGYSLLYYKMLSKAGIQNRILLGHLNNGKAYHTWNEVLIDGKWYHDDITSDDLNDPNDPNCTSYNYYAYYNLTDDEIKTNHSWTDTYPVANTYFVDTLKEKISLASDDATKQIYQQIGDAIGMQYAQIPNMKHYDSTYIVDDIAGLQTKIQEAINNGQTTVTVRYKNPNQTISNDVYTAIVGNSIYAKISGISKYGISYMYFSRTISDPNDIVLTINLKYYTPTSKKYIVTFKDNTGTIFKTENIIEGSSAIEPTAPTKEGYTFGGWYKDSTYTAPWDFTTDNVTSDTTLYAKWIINQYTVKFDSQGGSNISSILTDPNSLIAVPADPIKDGYTFGGWYKDATCTTPWDFTTDNVTSDTTLYAKWTINQYIVKFDSQDGSTVASISADPNSLIAEPVAPTKVGYNFVGWYKDSTCLTPWDFTRDRITGDTTLYTRWSPIKYTVMFNTQGGSSVKSITKTYNNLIKSTEIPTRDGYTFGGWYKEEACINVWNSSIDRVTENMTLYARWISNPVSPSNITTVKSGANSIKLTWDTVSDASGYEIYRSTSSTGTYSLVTLTNSTNYISGYIPYGTTYYYKVRAYKFVDNKKIYGDWSNIVYVVI